MRILIILALISTTSGIALHPNVAPGDLDPTFGNGGILIDLTGVRSVYRAVAIQPDGRIVAVGYSFDGSINRFLTVRYNSDGSLDTSFGTGGKITAQVGSGQSGAYSVAVQDDGKIIVGGSTVAPGHFSLVRYSANGQLDANFGSGGIVITEFSASGGSEVRSVRIQSDGKILAGGFAPGTGRDFGLARYNTDGSLDTSFGQSGKVITNIGALDTINSLMVDNNGKIVAVGEGSVSGQGHAFTLVRYNADGGVDTAFGQGGIVRTVITGSLTISASGTLQNDGRIVAVGQVTSGSNTDFAVARYNTDGSLDATFGNGGTVVTPIGDFGEFASGVGIQQNGKIIVVGSSSIISGGVNYNFALVRYNRDGSLDPTFGVAGKVSTRVNGSLSTPANAVALQADGNAVVVGQTGTNPEWTSVIARYGGDHIALNTPPFDFDGDGKTDIGIFRPPVGEWWYRQSSDGLVPVFQFGVSSDRIVPADFTGDGKTDIAVWRPSTGEWFVLRSEDYSYFSFPFGTNGDVPVPADYDADGMADAAVYRPSTFTWFVPRSGDGGTTIQQFGAAGDVPVPSDYDGDGKTDIAIFRPSVGQWWMNRSTAGVIAMTFGVSTDKAVQGDYTGDGKADVAVWRPSTGEWYILRSEDNSYYSVPFGIATDIPAPGDYDGDGKFDTTVFRPSSATWFVQRSTAGTLIQQFGATGDTPVGNAFVP